MSPGERDWGVDRGFRRMRPGDREPMIEQPLSRHPRAARADTPRTSPFAHTERTCRRQ